MEIFNQKTPSNSTYPKVYGLALSIVCSASLTAQNKIEESKSPNLLLIIADQWRSTAIGTIGIEPVLTPNVDRIAASGVLCQNATSHNPVSSPARASLMTGMYPLKHGVYRNCTSGTAVYDNELNINANCWSDILNAQGYSLGYIGKWHLDSPRTPYVNTYNNEGKVKWNEWCPPERRHGFSYWVAYGTYDRHLQPMYWDKYTKRDDFYYVDQWGPEYEADKAIEFLNNRSHICEAHKPFALVVSFNPPHTAYNQVPDKYKNMYSDMDVEAVAARFPSLPAAETDNGKLFRNQIKNYYACITGVDEQIGRIVSHLKATGLDSNTIIVILSDHGNGLGINNVPTKGVPEDVSMKIPLIFNFPEKLNPGVTPVAIDIVDVYPTVFGLMGKPEWIDKTAEGENLSSFLKNNPEGYPTVRPFLRYDPAAPLNTGEKGIRTDKYTYMMKVESNRIVSHLYYDNENDPYQMNNSWSSLSANQQSKVTATLKDFLIKISDPFADQLSN